MLGWVALGLALVGMPVVLWLVRSLGADVLSLRSRLLFWIVCAIVLLLLAAAIPDRQWLAMLGIQTITAKTLYWGGGGAVAVFAVSGLVIALQQRLNLPSGDRDTFAAMAARPWPLRLFLVITAAVTEELLYRGVGVGVGATLLGETYFAAALSLVAFTAAHMRWKWAHLPAVAAAGATLTTLFILSGDLWACVLAHMIVDAAGLLLAPAIMKARNRAKTD